MDTEDILRSILGGAVVMFLIMFGMKIHAGLWEVVALVCVGITGCVTICVLPRAVEVIANKVHGWREASVGTVAASAALAVGAPLLATAGALVVLIVGASTVLTVGALLVFAPLVLGL